MCDRGSAPSISAISRLLRGHDGDDSASEKKVSDGKFILPFKNIHIVYKSDIHIISIMASIQAYYCTNILDINQVKTNYKSLKDKNIP